MFFIGIDIGTSSISGVAYSIESHNIETITRDNCTKVQSTNEWENCQSPDKIALQVKEIVRYFTDKYTDIKGIGVTGQMHGMLYLDEQGDAVSPLYTWQDGRGNLIYKDGKSYAKHLSDETGYSLSTGFGLVTHFYNITNNLVPAKAAKLCTIMDYIVMKLSGTKTPLIDFSNGASLGFFDIKNLRFDTEALEKIGLKISILPNIDQSATLTGYYQNDIPVYSAIGDNQAAFLGSVRNINNSIHITVGTSSQISVYSEEFITSSLLDTRPFPGGGYILVGAALCGGQAVALLKDFYEQTLHLFGDNTIEEETIYKTMMSIPYPTDAQEQLVVRTLFDGTRLNPEERGSITNISRINFTPENITIGFLKGISEELYAFYKIIPKSIRSKKDRVIGSGNGLKKNSLLCEILEKQFNCKLEISQSQGESAFGACICGIVGGGYMKSFLSSS